jgi:hypothetical protein
MSPVLVEDLDVETLIVPEILRQEQGYDVGTTRGRASSALAGRPGRGCGFGAHSPSRPGAVRLVEFGEQVFGQSDQVGKYGRGQPVGRSAKRRPSAAVLRPGFDHLDDRHPSWAFLRH